MVKGSKQALFDAEKCLEKLDEPARQALKKFRDDNPDLPLSTSAGACLGVVPTSLSKPCTTACRQAHPSKCLGNGQRDVIGFATSAKGDKYANWRTLCRSCDNALQRHRYAVKAVSSLTGESGSVSENVVGDLVRIRGLASVRYLRFSQESNKDKNRRWWTCDPTKEQILFFLLICLRDHGVKGSKFGTTLQPEEIVEVLEGLDGTISCWYTAMECHIGGKADFHSVSFDRTRPDLPYDHPDQLVVPTSRALNEFFGDLTLLQRTVLIKSLRDDRDSTTPSEPLSADQQEHLELFKARITHFDPAESTRRRNNSQLERATISEPWTRQEAWRFFEEHNGVDEYLGVGVDQSQVYWDMGFDRHTDDRPYRADCVSLTLRSLNQAKSTFQVFKTSEALEAAKISGESTLDAIKRILGSWMDKVLNGYALEDDRVAAELQAARSDDIWDDGQEGIKAYLSSRSRYEEQEGEDSNDELHEDENYSSDPSDDEEGEGGTSDE